MKFYILLILFLVGHLSSTANIAEEVHQDTEIKVTCTWRDCWSYVGYMGQTGPAVPFYIEKPCHCPNNPTNPVSSSDGAGKSEIELEEKIKSLEEEVQHLGEAANATETDLQAQKKLVTNLENNLGQTSLRLEALKGESAAKDESLKAARAAEEKAKQDLIDLKQKMDEETVAHENTENTLKALRAAAMNTTAELSATQKKLEDAHAQDMEHPKCNATHHTDVSAGIPPDHPSVVCGACNCNCSPCNCQSGGDRTPASAAGADGPPMLPL